MKTNIASIDKVIRIVLALVFAVLFFAKVVTGTFGIVLLVLAAVLVLTSILGFCPLYWPFGISTKKKE